MASIQVEDTGSGIYVWDPAGRALGPIAAARAVAERLWDRWSIAELRRLVQVAETDYPFEGHTAVRFSNEALAVWQQETVARIVDEARRLTARWHEAVQALENSGGNPSLDRAEQRAFDELVEWIENHDMNYTRLDPRGPRPDGRFDPFPWDATGGAQ